MIVDPADQVLESYTVLGNVWSPDISRQEKRHQQLATRRGQLIEVLPVEGSWPQRPELAEQPAGFGLMRIGAMALINLRIPQRFHR